MQETQPDMSPHDWIGTNPGGPSTVPSAIAPPSAALASSTPPSDVVTQRPARHASPCAQVPHEPPHPSGPQVRPAQLGPQEAVEPEDTPPPPDAAPTPPEATPDAATTPPE